MGHRHAHRPAPDVVVVDHEAREEILYSPVGTPSLKTTRITL